METITILVGPAVKTAFNQASSETQGQLTLVLNLFFQEKLQGQTLSEVMAEISDQAQKRGLTPEILVDILADKE